MDINLTKTQQYLDWLKEKLYLDKISSSASRRTVQRGQVYRCKFGIGIGSEQTKERPCVILQYNSANRTSPNTIVAPITHTTSRLPIVVPISDKTNSAGETILDGNVLLGNISCISKARLGDYITDLTAEEMRSVDRATAISLDVNHYYQTLQNIYNDKLEYIEILKTSRHDLQTELAHANSELDSFREILERYNFSDIHSLENFLKES